MPEALKVLMFTLVTYSLIATAVAIRHTLLFAPPLERRRWMLPVAILAAVIFIFPALAGAFSGLFAGNQAVSLVVVYSVFAAGLLLSAVLSTRLIRRYPSH